MTEFIYLDHAATTPLRPEVRDAMEPFLSHNFANPSSIYGPAQEARAALDRARDVVASCLGAHPSEVVFTSGGSESDNAAIKGAALARQERGRHLVTTAIEHHAVLHPVEELCERFGFSASLVPVPRSGVVDVGEIERALRPDTTVLSVMWANNEMGTVQPIDDCARLARSRNITFHVDAVQAAGAIPIDLAAVPIDLLSISAHKLYGPKGVGVLVIRRGTPWWPLLTGGGQERNRRAGTENMAGIVGLARALELACDERESAVLHLTTLRSQLLNGLLARVPQVHVNGDLDRRLPGNLNVSITGVHGESLLVGLDIAGIMASSGSACTSGSLEPSHVLRALGQSMDLAQSSLRLTLGRENTPEQVDRTLDVLEALIGRLRRLAPAMPRA